MTTGTLPVTEPLLSTASTDVAFFAGDVASDSAAWQALIDELLRFYVFENDWDGDGAAAPNQECVEAAMNWVLEMAKAGNGAVPPSYVSLSPAGELLIVWEDESEYLEAEIVSRSEVEWMHSADRTVAEHWESEIGGSVRRR